MQNSAHVVGYSVAPVVRPNVARRAAGVCHGTLHMVHFTRV